MGISGLPDDAREAVYDVAGLFQGIATLRLLGILDERVKTLFQVRIVRIWSASHRSWSRSASCRAPQSSNAVNLLYVCTGKGWSG
jgi:hypothetical protein